MAPPVWGVALPHRAVRADIAYGCRINSWREALGRARTVHCWGLWGRGKRRRAAPVAKLRKRAARWHPVLEKYPTVRTTKRDGKAVRAATEGLLRKVEHAAAPQPPAPRPPRAASAARRPRQPPSCGGGRGSSCARPPSPQVVERCRAHRRCLVRRQTEPCGAEPALECREDAEQNHREPPAASTCSATSGSVHHPATPSPRHTVRRRRSPRARVPATSPAATPQLLLLRVGVSPAQTDGALAPTARRMLRTMPPEEARTPAPPSASCAGRRAPVHGAPTGGPGVHAVERRRGRREPPRRASRAAPLPGAASSLPGDDPPARKAARWSGAARRARQRSLVCPSGHGYRVVA